MAAATFYWYGVTATTTIDWESNTLNFMGSSYGDTIVAGTFQDSTHLDTGDASADVCTADHLRNIKYSLGAGSGTLELDGTSLAMCTATPSYLALPVHIMFEHDAEVDTQNVYFYVFDGTTAGTHATGVEVAAFHGLATGGTNDEYWKIICDASAGTGGDGTGPSLALTALTAGTQFHWYIGISASPETAGAKSAFDLGIKLEYF